MRSGPAAFGPARARGGTAAASPKVCLGGVTASIKLVKDDAIVALVGHAGGRLRLTHAGQASASAWLKRNEPNGTATWEGSSSWNKTISESDKSLKKIAPITDHVFRKCAKRSSPTPTKKSGAAKVNRRCLITTRRSQICCAVFTLLAGITTLAKLQNGLSILMLICAGVRTERGSAALYLSHRPLTSMEIISGCHATVPRSPVSNRTARLFPIWAFAAEERRMCRQAAIAEALNPREAYRCCPKDSATGWRPRTCPEPLPAIHHVPVLNFAASSDPPVAFPAL